MCLSYVHVLHTPGVRTHGATYVPRAHLSAVMKAPAAAAPVDVVSAATDARPGALAAERAVERSQRAARRARGEASSASAAHVDAPPAKRQRGGAGCAMARAVSRQKGSPTTALVPYEVERDRTRALNRAKLEELGLA